MTYELTSTDQLLCDCLGRADDGTLQYRLAQLTADEWTHLHTASEYHALTPLVYRRLKGLRSLPTEKVEPFRRSYILNARTNAIYFSEFTRLFKALQQAGLPVIVLKGAYLAEQVYRNIAARIIGDLDLVFRRTDLERSLDLVAQLGYANREYTLDTEQELSQELATPHTRPNSADLDFHWGLEATTTGFTIDMDSVWERSVPVEIAGVEVRTLCPVDMLLHLCLHTSYHHHFQGGLRGLADIREVITNIPLDWDDFIRRAQEWKMQRPAYFALYMCQDLTGLTLPGGVLQSLFPDDLPADLLDAALRNLFEPADNPTPMTNDLARMLTAESLPEKVRHWARAALPSRGLLARRYNVHAHSPRIWLYYPVRVYDLMKLYGASVLRSLRNQPEAIEATQIMQTSNELRDWMSDKLDTS